eukprot:391479-Pelagomonas_calceolata.AAC.1
MVTRVGNYQALMQHRPARAMATRALLRMTPTLAQMPQARDRAAGMSAIIYSRKRKKLCFIAYA